MRYYGIESSQKGVLPVKVRIADTFGSRLTGLAFRKSPESGLLIMPCSSIHTFWMKYDLHLLFLAGDGKILKVMPHVPPGRMASCRGAASVLEIPATFLPGCSLPSCNTHIALISQNKKVNPSQS